MPVANTMKPAALGVVFYMLAPWPSGSEVGWSRVFLCRLWPTYFGWKAGCSLDPSGLCLPK